jgi:hypothetical protein
MNDYTALLISAIVLFSLGHPIGGSISLIFLLLAVYEEVKE